MTSLDAQRNGKPSPQHPTAGADLLYACLLHRFTSSWVYHLASEDPMLCAGFFKQALQATRDKSPVRVHTSTPPVLWEMLKCCCIILNKLWVQVRVPDARKRPGGMSAVEAANSSWQSHTPTREAPKGAPRSRARPPACEPRQPCWTHCLIAAVCQLMRESLLEVPA